MIGAITAGLFSAGAPPVPATSYESIATTTVGIGGTTTVTFSSIPSTFKHLQIRFIAMNAVSAGYTKINFNSDTAANYAWHQIYANGSSVTSAGNGSKSFVIADESIPGVASSPAVAIIDIFDYQNTSKNKTARVFSGRDLNGSGNSVFQSGVWFNTNAITQIDLTFTTTTVSQYSSFALYGIKG